jgi:DNA-binding FadR family transcriptional regulator
VRAPKTAELIATQLRQRIARGELLEGDALPAETQLMDQFGVSRPILREAFRILESESLIEVRRGVRGGARVRLPDPKTVARYTALLLELKGTTVADVLDARRAIEPAAARMVAERRSPDVLAILRGCHEEELRTTSDVRARAAASARFHSTLIELSGNTTLSVLIGMLSTIIDHHNAVATARMSHEWRGFRGPYLHLIVEGHGRLLELIEAGQGEAAEQLWRQHMRESRESVDALLGDDRSTMLVDFLQLQLQLNSVSS